MSSHLILVFAPISWLQKSSCRFPGSIAEASHIGPNFIPVAGFPRNGILVFMKLPMSARECLQISDVYNEDFPYSSVCTRYRNFDGLLPMLSFLSKMRLSKVGCCRREKYSWSMSMHHLVPFPMALGPHQRFLRIVKDPNIKCREMKWERGPQDCFTRAADDPLQQQPSAQIDSWGRWVPRFLRP